MMPSSARRSVILTGPASLLLALLVGCEGPSLPGAARLDDGALPDDRPPVTATDDPAGTKVGAGDRAAASDPASLRERLGLEALPASIGYPPWNPPLPERIALGKLLFFDPILSGERDVACATCHHPDLAWADGRQLPVGAGGGHYHPFALGPERVTGVSALSGQPLGLTPRNAPTVLNTAFNGYFSPRPEHLSLQFWDGRVENGLEEQATKPPTSRVEMAGDAYPAAGAWGILEARLAGIAEYRALFAQAFPDLPAGEPAISAERVGQALAAFQRELVTPGAAYDRFVLGDAAALGAAQLRGLTLFFGQAGCGDCHLGPMLSNFDFHVQGVAHLGPGRPDTPGRDLGRGEVTGRDADMHAFRTPSLRNVALTAPYMHNGALLTLREVVDFYDRGGNDAGLPAEAIDPRIRPLRLGEGQKQDLVAFMQSLTGELPEVEIPKRVPSGLTPIFGAPADTASQAASLADEGG